VVLLWASDWASTQVVLIVLWDWRESVALKTAWGEYPRGQHLPGGGAEKELSESLSAWVILGVISKPLPAQQSGGRADVFWKKAATPALEHSRTTGGNCQQLAWSASGPEDETAGPIPIPTAGFLVQVRRCCRPKSPRSESVWTGPRPTRMPLPQRRKHYTIPSSRHEIKAADRLAWELPPKCGNSASRVPLVFVQKREG